MRTKWCHLNGVHASHEWGRDENPILCPGVAQKEDREPEEEMEDLSSEELEAAGRLYDSRWAGLQEEADDRRDVMENR